MFAQHGEAFGVLRLPKAHGGISGAAYEAIIAGKVGQGVNRALVSGQLDRLETNAKGVERVLPVANLMPQDDRAVAQPKS